MQTPQIECMIILTLYSDFICLPVIIIKKLQAPQIMKQPILKIRLVLPMQSEVSFGRNCCSSSCSSGILTCCSCISIYSRRYRPIRCNCNFEAPSSEIRAVIRHWSTSICPLHIHCDVRSNLLIFIIPSIKESLHDIRGLASTWTCWN